jgi:hypothetical protein
MVPAVRDAPISMRGASAYFAEMMQAVAERPS